MKIVKKLAIISMIVFGSYANGLNINYQYINELLNYNKELPKQIYNPFVIQQPTVQNNIQNQPNTLKKVRFVEKKLYLLAILNNKALVKVDGLKLEKWLKVGDKIDEYKLLKIIDNNSILVSIRNKKRIISMKKLNINIKAIK